MTNHFSIKLIPFLMLVLSGSSLWAQTTRDSVKNIGNENIVVVKDYQPTLSDAVKISNLPAADTTTAKELNLSYKIEPKRTETPFNTTPIKPVKIKDDEIKLLHRGYVKGGYGTHNTPYAEIYYNALRSKEFDAGIHYKHLSSTGAIKNYGKTDNSINSLELFGKKFTELGTLRAGLNLDRKVYHYYGYDRQATVYSKAETRQLFTGIDGNIGFDNLSHTESTYRYDAGISFYGYNGKRDFGKTGESNFAFNGTIKRQIADRDASADIKVDYTRTNLPVDSINGKNTLVGIYPRYTFEFPTFRLIAGVNTEWEANLNPKFHLYPHVEARYKLASDVLMIHAQVTGNMQKNSYKSLTGINPFTGDNVIPGNTNNKLDISGGLNIKLDKEILFSASASFNRLVNAVYFVNDSSSALDYTTFSTVYSDADVIKIKGELIFERNEKFSAHIGAAYTNDKPDDLAKAWFVPAVSVNLGGYYVMRDKIILKTDMYYRGERFAAAYDGTGFQKIKGYFDANLNIEYRYSKMLSVFAAFNNIGSVQYFNWYNYPGYRFQVMGGATLSF